jgi:hypothetical protein
MPDSFEGGPRRCFRHMLVCMDNINITAWPLHAYGQHLVQHYERLGALPENALPADRPKEALPRRLAPPTMPFARRKAGGQAAPATAADKEAVLEVAFQKRHGDERQLMNAAELLQRCNAWRFTTSFGVEVRANCWEVRGRRASGALATRRGLLLDMP